jgi:hypothetical protein
MLISREAVLALMPHQSLMKISGEPTHTAMKKLEKELAANLIAVECPWGHGYLGELLPAGLYTARYGARLCASKRSSTRVSHHSTGNHHRRP